MIETGAPIWATGNSAEAAVTLICCSRGPIWTETSTAMLPVDPTNTASDIVASKPAAEASNRYRPAGSPVNVYAPSVPLVVCATSEPSRYRTIVPATLAPRGSTTVPPIDPA